MPSRPQSRAAGRWSALLALALALGLLAAVACESEETAAPAPSETSDAAGPSGSEAATEAAPEPALVVGHSVGMQAPDFTLETVAGESITLSEVTRAGSPVLLYFFTTW